MLVMMHICERVGQDFALATSMLGREQAEERGHEDRPANDDGGERGAGRGTCAGEGRCGEGRLVRPGDHHRCAWRRRRPLFASGATEAWRPRLGRDDRYWSHRAARHGDAGRQPCRSVGRLSEGRRDQAGYSQRQPRPPCAGQDRGGHPQGQAREEVRSGSRHAGHVDGRAGARPAGADEEGRGDDRPADLQQPQPGRRRRAGAGQCRPFETGPGDDRADRGGKAAARPVAWWCTDDGRGDGLRQAAAGDQPYRRPRADRPSAQYRPTRRSRRWPTRAEWSASISCLS